MEHNGGPLPALSGWAVFWILAGLTAIEYFIAISLAKNVPLLAIIALLKAVLIVYYFMHISAVWHRGEDEH